MDVDVFVTEDKESFCRLIHDCIDHLLNKKVIDFKTSRQESLSHDLEKVLILVQNLCRKFVFQKTEKFTLKLDLPNLRIELQSCLEECFLIRKNEIEQFFLKTELSKYERLFVENFDWKIKWIMGTSSLSTLHKPILQIQFFCIKRQNDQQRPSMIFEMNTMQVEKFISNLENISKELCSSNSKIN